MELATATDLTDSATVFDFVVLDDVTPTVWPAGNVLAIHVVNTNWVQGITRVEAPAIVDWRTAHPLLRYSGFDNVQVMSSLTVKTPSWAVSLAGLPTLAGRTTGAPGWRPRPGGSRPRGRPPRS